MQTKTLKGGWRGGTFMDIIPCTLEIITAKIVKLCLKQTQTVLLFISNIFLSILAEFKDTQMKGK